MVVLALARSQSGRQALRRKRETTRSLAILNVEELEDRCLPSGTSIPHVILPGGTVIPSPPPHAVIIAPTYVLSTTHDISPQDGGGIAGYTPPQIRHAYGIDAILFPGPASRIAGDGTGETIAIVDAYDDPSIASDLATFDQQFGLPAPPQFIKVGIDANGNASTTNFPTPDSGWDGEIELDVEWSHAVAPAASIILVEGYSANTGDLINAIDYARNYPGVVAVSMSWGGGEDPSETQYDTYFTTPAGHSGVTFFASSGDSGAGTIWPSISSHVVATGGTTANLDSNGNIVSESGWSGSGGGISQYVSAPSYQNSLTIYSGDPQAGGMRAVPDVAYDSDPNTGVAVYGTDGFGGWVEVGGTSAASPQWAGIIAIADQGRALAGRTPLDGYTQTLPDIYKASADFNDITSGDNGYPAGPGFDLVTGFGSPMANKLMADLGAPSVQQVLTSVAITPANPNVGDGGQQQFVATGYDQYGTPMVPQPAESWSMVSGLGSITSGGLYSAPATGTGTAKVQVSATENGVTLTATMNLSYLPGPAISGLSANPNPVTGTGTTLTAHVSDPNGGNMSYTWSMLSGPVGATAPSFTPSSDNTTGGSVSTTVGFSATGAYQLQLSVTDSLGIHVTSSVAVTVQSAFSSLEVSPASVSLQDSQQQQFSAVAVDQFGNAINPAPSFSWVLLAPAGGTIDSNGLYTTPLTGTGTDTVQATATVNGVTLSHTATVSYVPGIEITSISANPNPVSGSDTTTLSATITDVNSLSYTYSWSVLSAPDGQQWPTMNPQSGVSNAGTITSTATFYGPGTFVFQLTAQDAGGLVTNATVTVTVIGLTPTITSLVANPNPVTSGDTTTLTAQYTDGNPTYVSYDWTVLSAPAGQQYPSLNPSAGDVFTNTITSTATFFGPGTYQFELTITDG
jgi:subtilase family serine protease